MAASPAPRCHPPRTDLGFFAIAALVATVSGWLLAMPWVPGLARCTLNRFHLQSSSFSVWAVQQPIPSMYNFANRYRVFTAPPEDPGNDVPADPPIESGYVNHFPTRMITFANARYRLLADRGDRWYEFKSAYRGQSMTSRVHVAPLATGELAMSRIDMSRIENIGVGR